MHEPIETGRDERIRDAITLAKNMTNNAASRESIAARLAGWGLD
jgi:hypothetical protein